MAVGPGRSQQSLAAELRVVPSKVVTLVDDLEAQGLVERRRNKADRRNYAIRLTQRGKQTLGQILETTLPDEDDLTASLTIDEHHQLTHPLQPADQQGLTPRACTPGDRQLPDEEG